MVDAAFPSKDMLTLDITRDHSLRCIVFEWFISEASTSHGRAGRLNPWNYSVCKPKQQFVGLKDSDVVGL